MAKEHTIRPTREIMPLRGIGGYIAFLWWTEAMNTQQLYDSVPASRAMATVRRNTKMPRLEVQQWEVEPSARTVEIPMGGGKGAISRRRVTSDFLFRVDLDLDMTEAVEHPGDITRNEKQPFVDGRLEGDRDAAYRIALRFHCGDPSFYVRPNLTSVARIDVASRLGIYYWCEAALIERVYCIGSSKSDDVIRYRVEGHGSAPLERYVDDKFCGAGLIDVSED